MHKVNSNLNSRIRSLVANKQLERDFFALKNDFEKTVYAEEFLRKNGLLTTLGDPPKLLSKDDKKSEELRVLGNNFYKLEKYKDALVHYNQSLCFASEESSNLGIAFANRSMIYFKLEFYEKCLENIELARKHNYPTSLMGKLKKREEDCFEILKNFHPVLNKNQKLMDDLLTPKLPRNKKCNFYVADCLEVKRNPEFGRHVITNCDLKVGTVISIEKPFAFVLEFEKKYEKCENCMSENLFSLLPCKFCPAVMFCSENCRDEAYQKFHKFECGLHGCDFYKYECYHSFSRRIFYEALEVFGTTSKLKEFMNSIENSDKHILDFDYGSSNENTKKQFTFHATCSLVMLDKTGMLDFADLLERYFHSISKCREVLNSSSTLRAALPTEHDEIIFKTTVHKFPGILSMNNFGMTYGRIGAHNDLSYGSGIFPFMALFSHSCAPNTMGLYEGDKVHMVVTRPIKKGQQVFDCYGVDHFHEDLQTRQMKLFQNYAFKCRCEACINNYEQISSNCLFKDPCFDKKFSQVEIGKLLTSFDLDLVLSFYEASCKYLKKYGTKNYSVPEIFTVWTIITQCWRIALNWRKYWNGRIVVTRLAHSSC